MGAEQASSVLATVRRDNIEAEGKSWSAEEEEAFKAPIRDKIEAEGSPYYATARLWDDGIILPSRDAPRAGAGVFRDAQCAGGGDAVRGVPDVTPFLQLARAHSPGGRGRVGAQARDRVRGYAAAGGACRRPLSRGRFPSPLPLSLRERGSCARPVCRSREGARITAGCPPAAPAGQPLAPHRAIRSPRNSSSFGSVTFFGLLASALA